MNLLPDRLQRSLPRLSENARGEPGNALEEAIEISRIGETKLECNPLDRRRRVDQLPPGFEYDAIVDKLGHSPV